MICKIICDINTIKCYVLLIKLHERETAMGLYFPFCV